MDSSIGWGQFWLEGDWITKFVGLVLLVMSVMTWSVLIIKLLQLSRLKRQAQVSDGWLRMDESRRIDWQNQADADDPYARLAALARQAGVELQQALEVRWVEMHIDPSDWVTRRLQLGIDQHWGRLQSRLTLLASVGATAPFVGLFGTVWGIYHALMNMGQAGQASIDQVAGPVGEALIMTAIGLAVAIPAVLAYNGLVRLAKKRQAHLREFASTLHADAVLSAGRPVSTRGG